MRRLCCGELKSLSHAEALFRRLNFEKRIKRLFRQKAGEEEIRRVGSKGEKRFGKMKRLANSDSYLNQSDARFSLHDRSDLTLRVNLDRSQDAKNITQSAKHRIPNVDSSLQQNVLRSATYSNA